MAATRCTAREIKRALAVAKAADRSVVPEFVLTANAGDKTLKFSGSVWIGNVEYVCAGDNGKIKSFAAVDDFLKFASVAAEVGDGIYVVRCETGSLLASTVPANMSTWAASQTVKLTKKKAAQQDVVAGIDVELAGMVDWENGNQAQKAKLTETQEQRVCVVADIAAIDAEITRLAALV